MFRDIDWTVQVQTNNHLVTLPSKKGGLGWVKREISGWTASTVTVTIHSKVHHGKSIISLQHCRGGADQREIMEDILLVMS